MNLNRVTKTVRWKVGGLGGQRCDLFKTGQSSLEGEIGMPVVIAEFPRFGGGTDRQQDYEVEMRWQDIEQAIKKFCEMGQADAIAVREAIKLASAAKSIGWHPAEVT